MNGDALQRYFGDYYACYTRVLIENSREDDFSMRQSEHWHLLCRIYFYLALGLASCIARLSFVIYSHADRSICFQS